MTDEEITAAEANMSAIAKEFGMTETISYDKSPLGILCKSYGYHYVAANGKRYEMAYQVPPGRFAEYHRGIALNMRVSFEKALANAPAESN